jgi:hypothetical protein
MTFDPEEGEMTREDVDNPKYNPEIHVDKLAFGYEPPKLCHLKREHRGVWTDGLSVAVKYPNESTTERYSAFQTLMSNRRHTFNELLNERRTVKEGFYTTDCIRCFHLGLKDCDGPLAGICKNCNDASAICHFDPDAIQRGGVMSTYVDQYAYQNAEDAITVRWAS